MSEKSKKNRGIYLDLSFVPCLVIVGILLLSGGKAVSGKAEEPKLVWSEFAEPAKEYRPFVRWWWPGNDVEEKELVREVDLLSDNYFGGAEIQPFEAALDPKADSAELAARHSFDSESYYQHVQAVMEQAKKDGLTIDLTLGSGWPSGGPHIQPEQSMKTMLWGETEITGPIKNAAIKIPAPEKPTLYKLSGVLKYFASEMNIRFMPEQARLVTVVAAKKISGARSKNPLNLTDSIKLDPQSVQVLGNKPDKDGSLRWDVPPGRWKIIAVYIAPDGQYISLSSAPGFVADYLDADSFSFNMEHLAGIRTGLQKYYGAPLRAFFNDSFELKTERFFTPDFLAEFQKRRGYDLAPFLPAVLIPGADNYLFIDGGLQAKSAFNFSPEDHRIQYDYQLTVSELFIERFIDNSEKWAEQRGLLSRVQAYGLNIDVLKAMGHAGIPETEQLYAGGLSAFLKTASSGAHLYNRPIVTAESMVWMQKQYMTTPLKFKAAADKLFSSGVNQVIFHGFPYKKDRDSGAPGWFPFAASHSENISEANPFWKFMPRINRYIARCQYALRLGKPEADLLIYYPFFGFPTSFDLPFDAEPLLNGNFDGEPESGMNQLVSLASKVLPMGADERAKWRTQFLPLLKDLEDNGYTWDWVNDDSLGAAKMESGKISIRGNSWKALLIFEISALQPETAAKNAALSKDGAAVIIVGTPPSEQPGYNNFVSGDKAVQASVKEILAGARARNTEKQNALKALAETGVNPGVAFKNGTSALRYLSRKVGSNGRIVFFANPEKDPVKNNLAVEGGCENAFWIDPWQGFRYGGAPNPDKSLAIDLPAFGSMILLCGDALDPGSEKSLATWPQNLSALKEIEIKSWDLSVSGDDVQGIKFEQPLAVLKDWREIKELKYCSSPGIYTTEINLPDNKPGQKAVLEIGWVYGGAVLKINDRPAGEILIPPFRADVSQYLKPGKNKIEITLTPALRNRRAGQAKKKDKNLIPVGVIGPVKISFY